MLNILDKDGKEILDEKTYCGTPDCLGEPYLVSVRVDLGVH